MIDRLRRSLTLLLLAAAAVAWTALPARAAASLDAALGSGGEVYLARAGKCAQLVGAEACASGTGGQPALAVEILRPGQDPELLLVPETEGAEAEGSPALVFEDATDSLMVVWESKRGTETSRVNLVWLRGNEWSEVVEITGDIHPLKGAPQLVITRDVFTTEGTGADGETVYVEHPRTVLHVTWWEQGAASNQVFYTPIVLTDGAYSGSNPVYNLSSFDPNETVPEPSGLPVTLFRSPTIADGMDKNSTVIGFVNPDTERFLAFDIQVVPGELSDFAERIRSHMIEIGARAKVSELPGIASRIRSHMIEIGHRHRAVLVGHLADEVEMMILSAGDGLGASAPLPEGLADRIRSHMIEIGVRTFGRGGFTADLAPASGRLLEAVPALAAEEVPEKASSDLAAPTPSQHLWMSLVADRPAPRAGDGTLWTFLSEDGRSALVGWQEGSTLLYLESTKDGWGGLRRMEVEGQLTNERVEQLLRGRVRRD